MEMKGNLRLLFLASVTRKYLPFSCMKLRSYYNSHLLTLANQSGIKLPKSFTNRNATCPYCCFPWSHNTASIKLVPSKKIKDRKQKNEVITNGTDVIIQQRNKLVVKCKVCNQKSPFSLVKKIKKPISNEEILIDEVEKPKKKKKKKKDKTCGLKQSAINQVKQKTESQTSHKVNNDKQISSNSQFVVSNKANSNAHKSKPGKSSTNTGKVSSSLVSKNKNLIPNPFASKIQDKLLKKNQLNLQKLREAVKSDKAVVKNTLKDFLSLVSK